MLVHFRPRVERRRLCYSGSRTCPRDERDRQSTGTILVQRAITFELFAEPSPDENKQPGGTRRTRIIWPESGFDAPT